MNNFINSTIYIIIHNFYFTHFTLKIIGNEKIEKFITIELIFYEKVKNIIASFIKLSKS